MIRQWNIKDTKGNSISIAAPSKYEAKKQFLNMIKGAEIVEITPGKVIPPRRTLKVDLPGVGDKFQPVAPVAKNPNPGPNKPCKCGSGRKYKKCCMRKVEETPNSTKV